MDLLTAGNVVHQLGGLFDVYWNSPQRTPIATILGTPDDEARDTFNALVDEGDQMMSVAVLPLDMLAQRPLAVDLNGASWRCYPSEP